MIQFRATTSGLRLSCSARSSASLVTVGWVEYPVLIEALEFPLDEGAQFVLEQVHRLADAFVVAEGQAADQMRWKKSRPAKDR